MLRPSFTPSESLTDLFPALFASSPLLQALYYHTLKEVFAVIPEKRKRAPEGLGRESVITIACDDVFNHEAEGAIAELAKTLDCDFFDACWMIEALIKAVPEERETEAYNALVIEVARLEQIKTK